MPAPWKVATAFHRAWTDGLMANIGASAKVAFGGWLVGSFAALVIGILIGRIRWVRDVVNPMIEVLRPVSALVWVPLAIVWFGIGYNSKLFIVALATFFVVVVYVISGAESIDDRYLKVARMLAMNRWRTYRHIVIPSATPSILIGLRQGLAISWGGVIIAELVAGDKGVGAMELQAQQSFDLNLVVVAMIVFAVLGFAAVAVFNIAERLIVPWAAHQRGTVVVRRGGEQSSRRLTRQVPRMVAGFVLLVALWWVASAGVGTSEVVLPSPGAVGSKVVDLLQQGGFLIDVRTSVVEFAIGYALAVVTAVAASIAFVLVPFLHRTLWSEVELLRFVIPFSWIPLAVLWFSTSDTGKIFVVWYAVFFSVIVAAYAALSSVDPMLMKAGRMLGMSWWEQTVRIRLRAALPPLVAAARSGVGIGWISVIAAEYLGAEHGLGIFITNAQETLDTTSVMAGMVVIGAIGAAMSALAGFIATPTLRRGESK